MNRRIKKKIAKRTIIFNRTAFKAMWTWISEKGHEYRCMTPRMHKSCWPEWEHNEGQVEYAHSYCMACDYAFMFMKFLDKRRGVLSFISLQCSYCPLNAKNDIDCLGGLYDLWVLFRKSHPEKAAEIALKIANLPIKKGVRII